MKHILSQYIDLIQERDEVTKRIEKLQNKLKRINEGGNVKDATGAGVQYFIFYIVLNIYPKLFSMLKF